MDNNIIDRRYIIDRFYSSDIYKFIMKFSSWSFTMPATTSVTKLQMNKYLKTLMIISAFVFGDLNLLTIAIFALMIGFPIGFLIVIVPIFPQILRFAILQIKGLIGLG